MDTRISKHLDDRYDRESLQDLMRENVVRFFFTKSNGEVREAFGTLNPDFIERMCGPKEEDRRKRESIPSVFHYFDINCEDGQGAWRCFRWDRFLGLDSGYLEI